MKEKEAVREITPAEKPAEYRAQASDGVRIVGEKEAREYLETAKKSAKSIALAIAMCFLSPVCLILFKSAHDAELVTGIYWDICTVLGVLSLVCILSGAMVLFVFYGLPLKNFSYMAKEPVDLDEAARAAVESERRAIFNSHIKHIAIAAVILSSGAVPVILSGIVKNDMFNAVCYCAMFVLFAAGMFFGVSGSIPWSAVENMLEEGGCTRSNKVTAKMIRPAIWIYWLVIAAIYLTYSLYTFDWEKMKFIWPVAVFLFVAVFGIVTFITRKDK